MIMLLFAWTSLITWKRFDLNIKVIGEAENGLQAVNKAEELCPDLIIMDIMMSEMDGIQATDIIKKTA